MKKITQRFNILLIFILIGITNNIFSQTNCSVSINPPTYSSNGLISLDLTANYQNGWNANVNVDFGDGTISSFYNQASFNAQHTYIVNGNYNVSVYIYSYNPTDTTLSCSSSSTISVNIANVTSCNLQTNLNCFVISANTISINAYSNIPVVNEYLIIDGQQIPYTDSMFYSFAQAGQHQVCYVASSADSLNPCSDSSCVMINTNGGGTISCQASFYIWQDTLSPSSSNAWIGINNSTGTMPLTYTWLFSDGSSSNQAYPIHVFSVPGNYVICLTITDANGCSSSMCDSSAVLRLSQLAQIGSLSIYPPNSTVGIVETSAAIDMALFPNPADENTSLSFISYQNDELEIEVLNVLGEKVFNMISFCQKGKNEIKIPTSELISGCFLVKIKKGKSKPIVLKLIRR
jgi:hypothetical protein